jgi:hypothetical protein
MRWCLLLFTLWALAHLSGCRNEAEVRAGVARDVETFSNDQCMKRAVSKADRARLIEAARAGRITSAHLDAYTADLRGAVDHAQETNMGIDRFCNLQRRIFKKHLRP